MAALSSRVCSQSWRPARHRVGPRPSRFRRVSSRLPARPSSVDVARSLAPLPSARASCLTIAAFAVVSLAPAHGSAILARVLSLHGASRAIAPTLGRLACVASRRGSPLGHLRSTSRARSLRAITSMSCLTVAAFVVVSLAPANGDAAFACVLSTHGASRALAPALGRRARAVSRRGSPLGHLRSASRARSLRTITSITCLTVAAFVVVSLAPPNGGAAFACVLSMNGASHVLVPALGRLARVASCRQRHLPGCELRLMQSAMCI